MVAALQNIDYSLIKAATGLTASSEIFSRVVFLVAQALILIYPLVLVYLWYRPEKPGAHHGSRKAVILAIMSIVVALAVKEAASFLIFRSRPFVSHPDLSVLDFHVDPQSFPSGHTMLAFGVSVSLYLSGYYRSGRWLILAALLIALARVFAGVHYPSDVLAGALIGAGAAWYLHREASSLKSYLPNQ